MFVVRVGPSWRVGFHARRHDTVISSFGTSAGALEDCLGSSILEGADTGDQANRPGLVRPLGGRLTLQKARKLESWSRARVPVRVRDPIRLKSRISAWLLGH